MNRFEDEVRWALQRRDPPPGFADRVLARIPQTAPKRSWLSVFLGDGQLRRRWVPGLAAALIALVAGGTWEYRQIEQRREGERAKQELIFALEITANKLQHTKTKLLRNVGGTL